MVGWVGHRANPVGKFHFPEEPFSIVSGWVCESAKKFALPNTTGVARHPAMAGHHPKHWNPPFPKVDQITQLITTKGPLEDFA